MSLTNYVAVLAGTVMAGFSFAASSTPDDAVAARLAELERGMQNLRNENSQLKSRLDEVMTQNGEKWLTEQRASEIRSVVQDVLSDADTRASLQAAQTTGGYDKGFFLASPDGNFKLKFGGQLQTRWAGSFYSTRDENILNRNPGASTNRGGTAPAVNSFKKSDYGFEVRRFKLDFSGHVIDPSWQYRMVLIYDRQGTISASNNAYTGGVGAAGGAAGVEDAYVRKDLGDGFALQFGQFKSPFLREELVSSKYQLAAERSIVNYMFTTKFTQGVMAEWRGDNLLVQGCYNDGGNNSTYGAVSGSNNGVGFTEWAFSGRVAYLAFGNWKIFDDMNSYSGDDQGLLFGLAANWQRGGQQSASYASPNNIPANGNSDADMLTWEVDATWYFGGANLFSQFVMNTAYSIPGSAGAGSDNSSINSYGLIVQGGYFISSEIETFARWEWMETANEGYNNVASNRGDNTTTGPTANVNVFNAGKVNIATIGMNWFVHGSKNVKFTVDYGWTFSGNLWFNQGIFSQNVSGADYRVEPKGGGNETVVRAQLQLLF